MEIIEKRIIKQDWYKTDWTVTGWDSHDWYFITGGGFLNREDWKITEILIYDKFGHAILAIAEQSININEW